MLFPRKGEQRDSAEGVGAPVSQTICFTSSQDGKVASQAACLRLWRPGVEQRPGSRTVQSRAAELPEKSRLQGLPTRLGQGVLLGFRNMDLRAPASVEFRSLCFTKCSKIEKTF